MDIKSCVVMAGALEFIVCVSTEPDELDDDSNDLNYIIIAYNKKYKFMMKAIVYLANKNPMDVLIDRINDAIKNSRIVAQFDRNQGVLNLTLFLGYATGLPIKYQAALVESKYNSHPIQSIIQQIKTDEGKYGMLNNYIRYYA